MTNLNWIMRLALAPIWAQTRQFLTYVVLVILLSLSIYGLLIVQREISSRKSLDDTIANGGDLLIDAGYAAFQQDELALIENISSAYILEEQFRTMIQVDGEEQTNTQLAIIRALDAHYPLVGEVEMEGRIGQKLSDILAPNEKGQYGILLSTSLAEYFEIEEGEIVQLAGIEFEYRGVLLNTPDGQSRQRRFISEAYISREVMQKPQFDNILANHRISLLANTSDDLGALKSSLASRFQESGWQITTSDENALRATRGVNASNSVAAFFGALAILGFSITIYALTRTHLFEDQNTRNNLKALGARNGEITAYYLIRLISILGLSFLILAFWIVILRMFDLSNFDFLPSHKTLNHIFLQSIPITSAIILTVTLICYNINLSKSRFFHIFVPIIAIASFGFILYFVFSMKAQALLALLAFCFLVFIYWMLLVLLKLTIRRTQKATNLVGTALLQFSAPRSTQENFGTLLFVHGFILASFLTIITGIENYAIDLEAKDYPSHYIADVQPNQEAPLEEYLLKNGAENIKKMPLLLARIDKINNAPITNADHWALRNDLVFGVDDQNRYQLKAIDEQNWELSIDQGLAEELELSLGDMISISSIGTPMNLKIKSFHDADISPAEIDFLFYIPSEALEVFPYSFLFSTEMPADKNGLYQSVMNNNPNLIIISSAPTISRLMGLFDRLMMSLALLGSYIAFSSLLAVISASAVLTRLEHYEGAVIHALGLSETEEFFMRAIRITLHFVLVFLALFITVALFKNQFASDIADLPIMLDINTIILICFISSALSILIPLIYMFFSSSKQKTIEKTSNEFQSLELDF